MRVKTLIQFQQGFISPQNFKSNVITYRAQSLTLSAQQDVRYIFTSCVNSLDIENCENRYLLSGCSDGSIYIHDLHNYSGKEQHTSECVAHVQARSKYAHDKSVECVTWFQSDNRLFISSGGDSKLKIWDTNSLKPVETYTTRGKIYNHQLSCVYTEIAVGSQAGVEVMDVRTGHKSHQLRGHQSSVLAVAWSPRDAPVLATAGSDSRAFLWDVRSAAGPLVKLDWDGASTAHSGLIKSIVFTPDGLHLLTLGGDHQLRLWDSTRGKPKLVNYSTMKNKNVRNVQIAVGPGVVYVPSQGSIKVLKLWTGEILGELCGHFNQVNCCVYRGVYQELYSGGRDYNVLVWKNESPPGDNEDGNITRDSWSDDELPS